MYELYKKRERVEKMFDTYKNVLDADRLYLLAAGSIKEFDMINQNLRRHLLSPALDFRFTAPLRRTSRSSLAIRFRAKTVPHGTCSECAVGLSEST